MAFTTVDDVKAILNIPSTVSQWDTLLTTIVGMVDSEIIGLIGHNIDSTDYVEKYDIDSGTQNELVLNQFPVISVTYVTDAGGTIDTANYYTDLEAGVIRLSNMGSFFTAGRQQVEVSYTAGYAATPADLSYAASVLCVQHFNISRHAGIKKGIIGNYQFELKGDLPAEVSRIIARYRRVFGRE